MKYSIPLIVVVSLFCFISAATCDPALIMAVVDGTGKLLGEASDAFSGIRKDKDGNIVGVSDPILPEATRILGRISDVASGSVAISSRKEYTNRIDSHGNRILNDKEKEQMEKIRKELEERRQKNYQEVNFGEFPNEIINESDYSIIIENYAGGFYLSGRSVVTLINNNEHRPASMYDFTYDDSKIDFDVVDWRTLCFYDIRERFSEEEADILFINATDYPITIQDNDFSTILEPRINNHVFGIKNQSSILLLPNDEPERKGWDYNFKYDNEKVTWAKVNDRDVRFIESVTDNETNKNEYIEKNNHIDVSIDQSQPIESIVMPQITSEKNQFPLPLINNFRKGMYYVQIGSYANVNTVYAEIAKIDNSLPVAVMRTTVKINGVNKEVHRILIGPLDYEKSLLLLRRFRVNYRDAFVWQGR